MVEKEDKTKSDIGAWIKDIIIALIIAAIVIQIVKPTIVKQTSMEPNFHNNDYLFIYKMAYKFGKDPQKGDVIVFKSNLKTEKGKDKLLIKRVIGLPGDKITINNEKVYINGKEDLQKFTKDNHTLGEFDMVVPKNSLFVLGDNRDVSQDSRSTNVGMVSKDKVLGKVVFRLLPFRDFGIIKNPYDE